MKTDRNKAKTRAERYAEHIHKDLNKECLAFWEVEVI